LDMSLYFSFDNYSHFNLKVYIIINCNSIATNPAY